MTDLAACARFIEQMIEKSAFILDLDGVVYEGSDLLPGVLETIVHLRREGKRVAFLTNNSASSSERVFAKLRAFGIPCEPHEVMTSGEATARFVSKSRVDSGRGVFVLGTDDLRREMSRSGVGLSDPRSCGAVVAGFHPEFSYPMICDALDALLRGVPLVACNRDPNYPSRGGRILPGCGAVIGALEGSTQKKSDYEIGKPNPLMLDYLLERLGVSRTECLVIGDSLDSDIRMANSAQVASVWLNRGRNNVQSTDSPQPTWVATDLRELFSIGAKCEL